MTVFYTPVPHKDVFSFFSGWKKEEVIDFFRIISHYRDAILPNFTEAVNILEYIDKVEADPETVDKVSVLPLLCGSGKSTAITKKMTNCLN